MQAPLAPAPPSIGPGTKLGEYKLVELRGKGGMGSVFRAEHETLGHTVAIKLLNVESVRPSNLIRLEQEAKKLALIQDVNVVQFKHYLKATTSTPPCIVMEYLNGETLSEHFVRLGKGARPGNPKPLMPIGDAVNIGCAMSRAISIAHGHGIVHRDLKPSNVFLCAMLGDGPLVKMIDLGIAKVLDNSGPDLTQDGTPMGTPGWMAPEQIKGGHFDQAADQYSLGAVLYFALTGRPPFPANPTLTGEALRSDIWGRTAAGKFAAPRALRPEIPAELEQIVLRAMQLEPKARFENARAMGKELLRFAPQDSAWRGTKFFDTPVPGGRAPVKRAIKQTGQTAREGAAGDVTVDPVTQATAGNVAGSRVAARALPGQGIRRRSRSKLLVGATAALGLAVGVSWAALKPSANDDSLATVIDTERGSPRSEIEIAPSVPTLMADPASATLPDYPVPVPAAGRRGSVGAPTTLGSTTGVSTGVSLPSSELARRRGVARKVTKAPSESAGDWDLVNPARVKKPAAGSVAKKVQTNVQMIDGVPNL